MKTAVPLWTLPTAVIRMCCLLVSASSLLVTVITPSCLSRRSQPSAPAKRASSEKDAASQGPVASLPPEKERRVGVDSRATLDVANCDGRYDLSKGVCVDASSYHVPASMCACH